MEGGRCCVEVTPGMREERSPISLAEAPLPAVRLPPLIPALVSPGKISFPSRKVRLSGQVICVFVEVGRGRRKMLIKGEEKSQFSPRAFPSPADLLSGALVLWI